MSQVQVVRFYPGEDQSSMRRAIEAVQEFSLELDARRESAAYTVHTLDDVVLVTTSASAITVTLPPIDSAQRKLYYIKKIDSGTGAITVQGTSPDTIDGGTVVLPTQYDVMVVMPEKATSQDVPLRNWHLVSLHKTTISADAAAFLAFDTSGQATSGTNPLSVAFATEAYDTGSNYSTPTFTAPVTGRYQLIAQVTHTAAAVQADRFTLSLTTSNRTYTHSYIVPPNLTWAATSDIGSVSISAVADMETADTAVVTLTRAGGTGTFTFVTTAGHNYFSGKLV